jgi:hypothetical protein
MTITQIGKVYRFTKNKICGPQETFYLHKLNNNGIWERNNEITVDSKRIRIEIIGRGERLSYKNLEKVHIGIIFYKEQPDYNLRSITKEDNLLVCAAIDAPLFEEDIETLDSTGHEGEIWNAIEGRWKWF